MHNDQEGGGNNITSVVNSAVHEVLFKFPSTSFTCDGHDSHFTTGDLERGVLRMPQLPPQPPPFKPQCAPGQFPPHEDSLRSPPLYKRRPDSSWSSRRSEPAVAHHTLVKAAGELISTLPCPAHSAGMAAQRGSLPFSYLFFAYFMCIKLHCICPTNKLAFSWVFLDHLNKVQLLLVQTTRLQTARNNNINDRVGPGVKPLT